MRYSEITGEPFEAKPAPGTVRRKRPRPPPLPVSYGINDMDRAEPVICNEGEMAYLLEMGQPTRKSESVKAKSVRSRTVSVGAPPRVKDAGLLASLQSDRAEILRGERGVSFAGMSIEQITAMLRAKT